MLIVVQAKEVLKKWENGIFHLYLSVLFVVWSRTVENTFLNALRKKVPLERPFKWPCPATYWRHTT